MRSVLPAALLVLAVALPAGAQRPPTHADSLRGMNSPERSWWDVAFYDLRVRLNPRDRTIRGVNHITYRVVSAPREMQLDLQPPLLVDSIVQDGVKLDYRRDGRALAVYLVNIVAPQQPGETRTVSVYYRGHPTVAKRAPWDGGIVWATDSLGGDWIATACQGTGASIWWPTKDIQVDEPDSQLVAVTVPDPIKNISNGRLRSVTPNGDGTTTWTWFVSQPINNYDIAINAGDYAHFQDVYAGEAGRLTLNYWPLSYRLESAKRQFPQVRSMLACFERWFGPYPWYADGFQLIETPHLGMEHQSGIAYGNHYRNGYLGTDLSGTGQGRDWDFIIVHESAHEWFGNSLTTADLADMWVHESFANYSEGIYVECLRGKAAGAEYIRGTRAGIQNDRPIIPAYGVNHKGSGDMYPKGGNMLHTIRQVINDDERWRGILRGLTGSFRHQIVTGRQVEEYISAAAGRNFSRVFAQYLTTTKIPVLEYRSAGDTLWYRWAEVVPGFDLPVRVTAGGVSAELPATDRWQSAPGRGLGAGVELAVEPDYYVVARRVE
jgi:aminopeptidase N